MLKKSISVILTLITIFSCMLPIMSVEANAATAHTITHHGYSSYELSQHPEIIEAGVINYTDANNTIRNIKIYARDWSQNTPISKEDYELHHRGLYSPDGILPAPNGCSSWEFIDGYPVELSNGILQIVPVFGCKGCCKNCETEKIEVTSSYNKIYIHCEDEAELEVSHFSRHPSQPVPMMTDDKTWDIIGREEIFTPIIRLQYTTETRPSIDDMAWDDRLIYNEEPSFLSARTTAFGLYGFRSSSAFERCASEDGLLFVHHGDALNSNGDVIMTLASQQYCNDSFTNIKGEKICNGHYICKGHVSEYIEEFDFYVNSCPHEKSESQQSYIERVREAFFKILKFFFPFLFD